ncbi:GNAT family N-acetyltransferase [Streptomyces sp. NPDC052299]|uniref:GNAT family N-acetyltransferase n=1 Tax=Streptomyces sp. NPDC052299 TaxID=3155054 RepID=UPI00343B9F05
MDDRRPVSVDSPPPGSLRAVPGLAGLLTDYHLCTEAEKGAPVPDPSRLPDRYRRETEDPDHAFADATVLVARDGGAAVGCVVVTGPVDGAVEVKRLWTDPAARGRGVATMLLGAALERAGDSGARAVRLSVWRWRTGAVALYERLGFTVVPSWDDRADLVCMERPA